MKILWLSDAGCTTGFGRVTHSIGDRLVTDYGHDISVLAVNHRGDHYDTPMKLYRPDSLMATDTYGTTRIVEMLGKVEPDAVVMLNDPQVLLQLLFENQYDPERILLRYRPILSYIPCDGYNMPPAWAEVLAKVTNVVAMSNFGRMQYPGSKLVYHGVDTDLFWPIYERPITLSNGDVLHTKQECKTAFGFDPKGFLVLRVDKNSGRKDFAATWKALRPVMVRHPDIQLHFHCAASQMAHGTNLQALFSREPRIARDRYFFPDLHSTFIGWSQQDLNGLYNAADLFVSTSRGEGFGLTLAEAAACGIPIVAQNVSAIPEVVGSGGLLVEPQRLLTVPSGQDVQLADIDAFSEAIEQLYESRTARRRLGEAGVEHVRKSFSWDYAAARFHEFLEGLKHGSEDAARGGPGGPGDPGDTATGDGGGGATDDLQGLLGDAQGGPVH